jgi:hypothetical protein
MRPAIAIATGGLAAAALLTPPLFRRLFSLGPMAPGDSLAFWGASAVLAITCTVLIRRPGEKPVLLLAAALVFVFAELGTRFVARHVIPSWRASVIAHGVVAYRDRWRFRGHPFLQYVGNHGYYADSQMYNLVGFPGAEHDRHKPAHTIRIVCIGGSTTELGYPASLESWLNARAAGDGLRFEVLNFGLSGYTSAHSLITFVLNAVDYDPDYVVLQNGWNDMVTSNLPNAEDPEFRSDYSYFLKQFDPPRIPDGLLIRVSVLYRELRNLVSPYDGWKHFARAIHRTTLAERPPATQYRGPGKLQAYWRNVRTVIDVARGRGIHPVMTTQPHATDPGLTGFGEAPLIDAANRTMRDSVRLVGTDVLFVDLDAALTGHNTLFVDVAHVTQEGARREAALLGEVIYGHLVRVRQPEDR